MGEDSTSRPKKPTIYDVAEEAGVAPSTVSRTFARPGRVGADTAARVRKAARTLGYRTQPLEFGATSRTSMVALVIADVTNPFHFGIIRGAEEAAADGDYTMVLADSQESATRERALIDRVRPSVEGIVLASPRMSDSAIRMVAKQMPTTVLNRAVPDVPSVVTDVLGGVRRAVRHLSSQGHRTITYLAGPEASWTDGMRWRALLEVAPDYDVKVRRHGPFAPTVKGGMRAATLLAKYPPTAVLAFNDSVAIGVLRELQTRGLRVPEDVSVVGFDDIFSADLVSPGLTTVAAPLRWLGNTAMKNLLALIHGAQSQRGEPARAPTKLVVRGSTAAVGQQVATRCD